MFHRWKDFKEGTCAGAHPPPQPLKLPFVPLLAGILLAVSVSSVQAEEDGKLRIIVFGAHPDDAQYKAGGSAAKWVKAGHEVKLVSVTNGDVGHWQSAGGPLTERRLAEVKKADALIGAKTEVLDIHDGEAGAQSGEPAENHPAHP